MEVEEIKISYTNNTTNKVVISNSKVAYDLILEHWNKNLIQLQEETKVIFLDMAQKVIGIHDLSKGGVSNSVVDIKIILGIALKCLASGIIIVHNHPSGSMVASEPDLFVTKKMKLACELMEITLVDHLIISKDDYLSLADKGYM